MLYFLVLFFMYSGNMAGQSKSKLPETTPADIRIFYKYDSGMMQDAGWFDMENNLCKYEYRKNGETKKGAKRISPSHVSYTYRQLRQVGFDKINVKHVFAHDASNTTIVIYWSDSKNRVEVSRSAADKMSDKDLQAWKKSVKIIEALLK